MSSQIYKKYNWQRASAELAICIATRRGVPGGPKSATACNTCGRKIILVDLNLAVQP